MMSAMTYRKVTLATIGSPTPSHSTLSSQLLDSNTQHVVIHVLWSQQNPRRGPSTGDRDTHKLWSRTHNHNFGSCKTTYCGLAMRSTTVITILTNPRTVVQGGRLNHHGDHKTHNTTQHNYTKSPVGSSSDEQTSSLRCALPSPRACPCEVCRLCCTMELIDWQLHAPHRQRLRRHRRRR